MRAQIDGDFPSDAIAHYDVARPERRASGRSRDLHKHILIANNSYNGSGRRQREAGKEHEMIIV